MPSITTKDGAKIFYKDWGSGQPVVFSHGWPLNADAWDEQLQFFASQGFRAIAHDRRGHGRSTQTWSGNDMNTYADDLAAVTSALDLRDAIHIGHSTGGGEVARYIGRHGTNRVAKVVLVSAVVPGLLKTSSNPNGIPLEAFDRFRASILSDRAQFWKDLSKMFYGANRPGSKVSEGVLEQFWRLSIQAGIPAAYDCIKAFSETDFTSDAKKIDDADPDHSRRRRSDRPNRDQCDALGEVDRRGIAAHVSWSAARADVDASDALPRRPAALRQRQAGRVGGERANDSAGDGGFEKLGSAAGGVAPVA